MGRNRTSAKRAGANFEIVVRDYLSWALNDDRILRGKEQGRNDKGDIANIYFMGQHVCIECKDTAAKAYRAHMVEAMREAGNLDAPFYFVVQKITGIGLKSIDSIGRQLAYTTVQSLEAMRDEAPDDLFLHNTNNFYEIKKYPFMFTDLRSLATILNHGVPLGEEMP